MISLYTMYYVRSFRVKTSTRCSPSIWRSPSSTPWWFSSLSFPSPPFSPSSTMPLRQVQILDTLYKITITCKIRFSRNYRKYAVSSQVLGGFTSKGIKNLLGQINSFARFIQIRIDATKFMLRRKRSLAFLEQRGAWTRIIRYITYLGFLTHVSQQNVY